MPSDRTYLEKYEKSWALVIGVNDYHHLSPLAYARADASAIAELLQTRFGFEDTKVHLLLDENATRDQIMSQFLRFTDGQIARDDRVVVFFAGHGLTRTGHRGEVGYLVPVDGNPSDLSTLIPWDYLTKGAELIGAKHMLLLIDACFGGLAVTRAVSPGSARFLRDMMQRYSRQVLTAGKADETVSDAGGPMPGHSIFTGHLLQALEGEVTDSDGIVSANPVMAYVYERVSKDPESKQSPHYGYLDGDGDFIFLAPNLDALTAKAEIYKDVLVQVPDGPAPSPSDEQESLVNSVKELLSESRHRIALDDLATAETRTALAAMASEAFPVYTPTLDSNAFAKRLNQYERAIDRLIPIVVLIARWGTGEHQEVLRNVIARLADSIDVRGGTTLWLRMRWYPVMLLMYYGGIAAVAADNYRSLSSLLMSRLHAPYSGTDFHAAVVHEVEAILELRRLNMFETLPGHERQYVPISEYLYQALQPRTEDLIFLGANYEDAFDRFEILHSLIYSNTAHLNAEGVWGPPGRFWWKHSSSKASSPFEALIREADEEGPDW